MGDVCGLTITNDTFRRRLSIFFGIDRLGLAKAQQLTLYAFLMIMIEWDWR